jgi:hypothetical protein
MRNFNALHTRHANIEQYHVRLQGGDALDGFLAVARFTDDVDGICLIDQPAQPVAGRLFIVNDQDLHEPVSCAGKRRQTL